MKQTFDVAIIGGGINGCGSAADAALRGLSVYLCEADDLASKTSSCSSKLIHGGLRYLEHYNLSLVKKSLDERAKLLQLAPHLVYPLPFVLPYKQQSRPFWLLRLGLFLYDNLSRTNTLPKSFSIRRRHENTYFSPLENTLDKGLIYWDATADDARLTITNALQAKEFGATIHTQTKLIAAESNENVWQLRLRPKNAPEFTIQAKSVINAAGPWVLEINNLLNTPMHRALSLVKGSHLVIPKLYSGNHAYLLQNDDNRVVFAIPFHGNTLIGTTDIAYTGSPNDLSISPSEIDYLCAIVNRFFKQKISAKDIVTTWSGVRPLLFDEGKSPSQLSRDYAYYFTQKPAPLVTLYGGKITTYRKLALEAVDSLQAVFDSLPPSETHRTPLPGATWKGMPFLEYLNYAHKNYAWLDEKTKERYLHQYGTRTEMLLSGRQKTIDLGLSFGNTLYQAEVDYLVQEEWATCSEDILWRRTKLGLSASPESRELLDNYLQQR